MWQQGATHLANLSTTLMDLAGSHDSEQMFLACPGLLPPGSKSGGSKVYGLKSFFPFPKSYTCSDLPPTPIPPEAYFALNATFPPMA